MSDIKKWISLFEEQQEEKPTSSTECSCSKWNCKACFPEDKQKVDEGNWYEPEMADLQVDSDEVEVIGPEDYNQAWDMISIIKDAQLHGTGNAERNYSESELESMSMAQLRAVYKEVTGTDLIEAGTKTKDKTGLDFDPLGDIEDILNPKLPATQADPEEPSGNKDQDMLGSFSKSSAANTRAKTSNINPSDTMRDYMNRIDPDAVEAGSSTDDVTGTELVNTGRDVRSSIENAMVQTGFQSPEWHHLNNLPGFMQRVVRDMGSQLFGMFTSTPVGRILTIANVEGQGPNSDAEMRAVAAWLLQNAEDLGEVKVSHGMAIPGYEPDVREFRANGVRFHVVRDPMGQYIYAYPEKDAKSGKQEQQTRNLRGNTMPRINEHYHPSLMEQLAWDEEIDEVLREEDLEESTLSKLIGKQKGGQRLVKWLHGKHKLSNEAQLEPVPFNKELLWTQFKKNPDDFVIVSAANGVAGIKPSASHIQKMTELKAKKGQTYNPARDATLPYQIIAFTDDGQQVDPALLRPQPEAGDEPEVRDPDPTVMKARMGKSIGKDIQNSNNTFALLQDQIGTLKTVWISGWSGYRGSAEEPPEPTGAVERDKIKRRADMKVPATLSDDQATNQIFKRVRPVLSTVMNQAVSHIMRRAQRYIEGGNFEGATSLSKKGENLKKMLAAIDTTRDVTLDTGYGSQTRELSQAVMNAIDHAYSQAGDGLNKSEYLNSVAKGNALALKPILDGIRAKIVG